MVNGLSGERMLVGLAIGIAILIFFIESFNRFPIISLDVLICRYSP